MRPGASNVSKLHRFADALDASDWVDVVKVLSRHLGDDERHDRLSVRRIVSAAAPAGVLSRQLALTRWTDRCHHRVLPPEVDELVVATVATVAENLKHVAASAAVALGWPGGGNAHESVCGRRSATASARKLPPSSIQRSASSRA
jgi:hypothetical protein